ncbi:hypothetical protein GCM10023210_32130 [Chryseobacterium ginsengisoli]|uniref:Leucine-rich repeat domain-containing protein n=1 Tax=Chryseobacterium ginsengisoli TaxID=363853 RepID=A0ABP9MIV9_9FLAO
MNLIEQAINAVEKNLKIRIKEFDKAHAAETQYNLLDEKFISLQLTDLHFDDLDALQPLFNIVKALHFFDCTFTTSDTDNIVKGIRQFTALETILVDSGCVTTIKTFLRLETIKELQLIIDYEMIPTNTLILDFKELKSIKNLRLYSYNVGSDKMFVFKGAEYLTNLEKLTIECDCIIEELNKFKNLKYLKTESIQLQATERLESLKTLEIVALKDEYTIYTLEQFPNLENLKIRRCNNINLGELKKLKILSISSREFELEKSTAFENLPNLEQLEFNECKITEIKNLDKLSNLRVLNLYENYTIENIDGIENLKNLEYINLYENKISDIRVLNKLPNLKEVNVAGNNITQEDVDQQLEKSEIARFLHRAWRPKSDVPFYIWDSVEEILREDGI